MAKAKKHRKPRADSVYAKKAKTATNSNPFALAKPATAKHLNPFEVHVNKEKFQIIGRTCKHDKGLPGVSRAKAIKRRQQTLGLEYQSKHKTNKFQDRRIGRYMDQTQLPDDVINARFLADKMTDFKGNKTSKFDLNDEEVLTHHGTTLEEIEQFRDERSDDEELADEQLEADFIEAAHFGGGAAESEKDRKAAIEEMILEQKKRKVEIAKEKDELHDLTAKLDSNYKELVSLMGKMSKKDEQEKPPPDDFDKIMREMIFEPRSAVCDRLQSEEEVAKKEKERLEKLEQERLRRMHGDTEVTEGKEVPKHRSADDLDDGYCAYEEQHDGHSNILAYNEKGELNAQVEGDDEDNAENSDSDEAVGTESEEEVEGEDSEYEEENENDENGTDGSEDDLSDLKVESSDEENDLAETKTKKTKITKSKKKLSSEKNEIGTVELPYTIDLPVKYEDFLKLLNKYTAADQATIVERIVKCNHPKLEGVNREKVVRLFAFLLQYINELFAESNAENIAENFSLLNGLNPHLYDLMHLNAEKMSSTLLEVIKEKYANFSKQPKVFPTLDTLIFFKLASNFFTTSDFRHPVVSPCFLFIEQILSRARVRTRQDLAGGLFLLTIILEYTQQSKRFLPASFNFLMGSLHLCVPKQQTVEMVKIVPPFQARGAFSSLMVINKAEVEKIIQLTSNEDTNLKSEDLVLEEFTSDFKVRALNFVLRLIQEFAELLFENIGANYLATPLLAMLARLPLQVYPEHVQTNFDKAKQALEKLATKPLTKLVPPEKKPKALRLLEPRFEAVYDDKRRPKMSKEKEEKAKLLQKIKRETKGAVREIRRDTEFLQKMRIQQQIKSDLERHEKVKRIFQEASVQQGELNELARAKKRKKF